MPELGEVYAYVLLISGRSSMAKHPNTPCHVPRFREPFVIGTDIVEPTRVALVCETLCLLGLRKPKKSPNSRITAGRYTIVRIDRHSRIQWRHTLDLHQCASISKSPERWCPAPYPCLGGYRVCRRVKTPHHLDAGNHLCEHLYASQIHRR